MTCVNILYKSAATADDDNDEAVVPAQGDKDSDHGEGWVAAGSREGDVHVWRLEGGRFSLSQQIPAHKRQV